MFDHKVSTVFILDEKENAVDLRDRVFSLKICHQRLAQIIVVCGNQVQRQLFQQLAGSESLEDKANIFFAESGSPQSEPCSTIANQCRGDIVTFCGPREILYHDGYSRLVDALGNYTADIARGAFKIATGIYDERSFHTRHKHTMQITAYNDQSSSEFFNFPLSASAVRREAFVKHLQSEALDIREENLREKLGLSATGAEKTTLTSTSGRLMRSLLAMESTRFDSSGLPCSELRITQ